MKTPFQTLHKTLFNNMHYAGGTSGETQLLKNLR